MNGTNEQELNKAAINYFKYLQARLVTSMLKSVPKDSVAYRSLTLENQFYDMAIGALKLIGKQDVEVASEVEVNIMKLIIELPDERYKWIVEHDNTDFQTTEMLYNQVRCAVPVESVGHTAKGTWNGIDDEPYEDFECDACGHVIYGFIEDKEPNEVYKFCPNCGADMRG